MAISRQKEARSRNYALLLFQLIRDSNLLQDPVDTNEPLGPTSFFFDSGINKSGTMETSVRFIIKKHTPYLESKFGLKNYVKTIKWNCYLNEIFSMLENTLRLVLLHVGMLQKTRRYELFKKLFCLWCAPKHLPPTSIHRH